MLDRLAGSFFILALVFSSITYGVLASLKGWYPADQIKSIYKTVIVYKENHERPDHGKLIGFVDSSSSNGIDKRLKTLDESAVNEPILVFGGRFQFGELCPQDGCLAVSFNADGSVLHAYPYRPDEIFAANSATEYPYQAVNYSFAKDIRPVGIKKYNNDDLLVVFQHTNTFPFSGGSARIDKEGHPIWYRMDYSHHWPTMLDDDQALVPNLTVGEESLQILMDKWKINIKCETNRPLLDTLTTIDKNGETLESVSMMDALLQSPFAPVLQQTSDPCDPLHLNYIDIIKGDTSVPELNSGDYIVSFRNISSIAIIDGKTKSIKKLIGDSFIQQHSAQHLADGKILVFDNQGADLNAGPSRLLMIDISGGLETTIFPNESTPDEYRDLLSFSAGKLDISTDKKRAFIAFSDEGRAVEVRLSDGKILRVFESVHDVSMYQQFSNPDQKKAAYFKLYGVDYL